MEKFKIAIILPEGETYSFTRKFCFHIFNTAMAPIMCNLSGETVKQAGYFVFPYPVDESADKYKLILSVDLYNPFDLEHLESLAFYQSIIIIGDEKSIKIDDKVEKIISISDKEYQVNNILDISELKEYYEFDLNFSEYVAAIMSDRMPL